MLLFAKNWLKSEIWQIIEGEIRRQNALITPIMTALMPCQRIDNVDINAKQIEFTI